MKKRGSVVSLSVIFPHPPEDTKQKQKTPLCTNGMQRSDRSSEICFVYDTVYK